MIYLQLFLSFLQVGMFSIGGGYAAMPLIQSEVVQRYGWLSMNEFTDLITIAEMTPGPITVNSATFVGVRIAGIPGAIVATLGCIFPSLIIVSILSFLYYRYRNLSVLQNILSILRPVIVALIASAGLSIFKNMAFRGKAVTAANLDLVSITLFAAAFVAIRKEKQNPILVMCLCGVARIGASVFLHL